MQISGITQQMPLYFVYSTHRVKPEHSGYEIHCAISDIRRKREEEGMIGTPWTEREDETTGFGMTVLQVLHIRSPG